MQHIKAIINSESIILLDSDNAAIIDYIPELQAGPWCYHPGIIHDLS